MQGEDKYQFGDLNPQAELANLAKHHIVTTVCIGGRQVFPTGPCDHCGSANPSVQCLAGQQATIGTPLITE